MSEDKEIKLTACVLTCNNEETIERCLRSLRFADEILVVDSGSSDNTLEIAERLADRVIRRHWPGYKEQRIFAIEDCRAEWMFFLDSDEEVTPELAAGIREAVDREFVEENGFVCNRRIFYLGRWQRQMYPDKCLNLFRRSKAGMGGANPHPVVEVEGKVGHIRGDIIHHSYRNITHHVEKMNNLSSWAAGSYVQKGRRAGPFMITFRMMGEFMKKYFIKGGILDGRAGFMAAVLSSFYTFLKFAKLWEANSGVSSIPPEKGEE